MKHSYKNIDPDSNRQTLPDAVFKDLEIPYNRTGEEVWAEMEKKLVERAPSRTIKIRPIRFALGVAASLLLLAGIFLLLRFSAKTVYCPAGQHISHVLPDGSTVELNADSRLSYYPSWWRFARKLKFNGEGFFTVEKGRTFEIASELGRTIVLGTSFNIYSREDEYSVTCITGRVKVISFSSDETVLIPEYQASIEPGGNIKVWKEKNPDINYSWVNNMFSFSARPLFQVFEEIGRQYGVAITYKPETGHLYSGYFSKNKPVEEVLVLVCKPFGLTFTRISEKEFEILQN